MLNPQWVVCGCAAAPLPRAALAVASAERVALPRARDHARRHSALTVSCDTAHLSNLQGKEKGKLAAKDVADIVYEDGAGGKVSSCNCRPVLRQASGSPGFGSPQASTVHAPG